MNFLPRGLIFFLLINNLSVFPTDRLIIPHSSEGCTGLAEVPWQHHEFQCVSSSWLHFVQAVLF